MELNFWNITFVVILLLDLGICLAKHGKYETEKYNFWESLLTSLLVLFILYKGGFFN